MIIHKKVNNWLAIKLTMIMSTMWCVYAFLILAILPLMSPGLETICMYLSSTVIQLVALPLIIVGQKLLNENSEIRAEEDHNAVMKIVKDIHHMISEEDTTLVDVENIKLQLVAIQETLKKLTEHRST